MARIENNIRRLRKLHQATLSDLARVLDVSESAVSKWETGARECPDEFKVRIARHFGWPVHAVFLFDTDATPASLALRSLIDRIEFDRVAS